MDDQFATAEARCEDLQEKIDLIKSLKRKRKLKKRRYHYLTITLRIFTLNLFLFGDELPLKVSVFLSMTRVTDQPMTPENVPFITVRTQPKKSKLELIRKIFSLNLNRISTLEPSTTLVLVFADYTYHCILGVNNTLFTFFYSNEENNLVAVVIAFRMTYLFLLVDYLATIILVEVSCRVWMRQAQDRRNWHE